MFLFCVTKVKERTDDSAQMFMDVRFQWTDVMDVRFQCTDVFVLSESLLFRRVVEVPGNDSSSCSTTKQQLFQLLGAGPSLQEYESGR